MSSAATGLRRWSCTAVFVVGVLCVLAVALAGGTESSPGPADEGVLDLTAEEKRWLKEHSVVRIGVDPDYAPYQSLGPDGEHRGMVADYVRLVERRTGLTMEPVRSETFAELMTKIRRGEIDVAPLLVPTPQRRKRLHFTKPYLRFPSVIVSPTNSWFFTRLEDLHGRKVAAVKGYYLVERLRREHPEIGVSLFSDPATALHAVAEGEAQAYVGNLAMVSYAIRKHDLSGLAVSAHADLDMDAMSWGVRKEWPELASILNKVLETVDPKTRRSIYDKWVVMPFEAEQRMERILTWTLRVAVVAGALLLVVLLWNRRLRREVRERTRAEAALRQSESRYRSLFENSPIPLWAEDWSGVQEIFEELRSRGVEDFEAYFLEHPEEVRRCHRNVRILEANQAAVRLYDAQGKNELTPLDMTNITPEEALPCSARELAALARGRTLHREEQPSLTLSGRRIQVDLSLVVQPGREHDLSRVHAYTLDVTEQRRVEEDLRRAKEAADEANQAKSRFLAAMSHEIRTPVNAIAGMADLVLATSLNSVQRDCLQTVSGAVEQLLSVINDILDFSKIEASRLELDHADFDLNSVLDKVSRICGGLARDKGLDFAVRMDDDVPRVLKGDSARLAQVLINLASNAVKFTPEGEVEVTVRRADGEGDEGQAARLRFAVRDTGIGIAADKIDSVFERFRQLDGSMTRRAGGTGLGLAISRRLVRLMGGELEVRSQEGEGSEFFFVASLERGDPAEVAEDPARPPQEIPPPLDVLLAEDNPANVKVATLQLSRMGHSVEAAGNGLEAVELLRQRRFDVVLMDMEMPEMDGMSATRAIREGQAGREQAGVPIVALTAHALEEVREQARQAGVQACLTKPVNYNKLASVLVELFGAAKTAAQPAAEPEPEPGGEQPVLDTASARKAQGVDAAMFRSILEVSLRELDDRLARIAPAVQGGDMENLRIQAHTIKGTAASMGAYRLSRAADDLESAAKNGREDGLDGLVDALVREAEQARRAVAAELAGEGGGA